MICQAVDYVFESIALMEMSKEKGLPLPGNTALGIVALVGDCVSLLATFLSFFWYGEMPGNVLWLFATSARIVSFIAVMVASYQIFTQRKKKYAVLYTVFSILTFGFLRAIFLFAVRKGEKKEPKAV